MAKVITSPTVGTAAICAGAVTLSGPQNGRGAGFRSEADSGGQNRSRWAVQLCGLRKLLLVHPANLLGIVGLRCVGNGAELCLIDLSSAQSARPDICSRHSFVPDLGAGDGAVLDLLGADAVLGERRRRVSRPAEGDEQR
ncbi:MAG: hypothetical protein ACM3NV_07525, partial [Syntrophothermus sp.]